MNSFFNGQKQRNGRHTGVLTDVCLVAGMLNVFWLATGVLGTYTVSGSTNQSIDGNYLIASEQADGRLCYEKEKREKGGDTRFMYWSEKHQHWIIADNIERDPPDESVLAAGPVTVLAAGPGESSPGFKPPPKRGWRVKHDTSQDLADAEAMEGDCGYQLCFWLLLRSTHTHVCPRSNKVAPPSRSVNPRDEVGMNSLKRARKKLDRCFCRLTLYDTFLVHIGVTLASKIFVEATRCVRVRGSSKVVVDLRKVGHRCQHKSTLPAHVAAA